MTAKYGERGNVREHFELPEHFSPTVIAAFQGWNDPAGAGLDAMEHLSKSANLRLWASIDPQEYYDFQVNQPRIEMKDGQRVLTWRTTEVYAGQIPGLGDVLVVHGIEPSFRWKAFLDELVDGIGSRAMRYIILGVVQGDVAHSRPFPTQATSPQPLTRATYDAETPNYVGPSGIIGVLIDRLSRSDAECLSLWCVTPQYATGGPTPKAAMSLLVALGRLLRVSLPLGDLEEESRAWERGVDELVASDVEMRSYVKALEDASDIADLPEAQGDAIAQQFEQFLRRREEGTL